MRVRQMQLWSRQREAPWTPCSAALGVCIDTTNQPACASETDGPHQAPSGTLTGLHTQDRALTASIAFQPPRKDGYSLQRRSTNCLAILLPCLLCCAGNRELSICCTASYTFGIHIYRSKLKSKSGAGTACPSPTCTMHCSIVQAALLITQALVATQVAFESIRAVAAAPSKKRAAGAQGGREKKRSKKGSWRRGDAAGTPAAPALAGPAIEGACESAAAAAAASLPEAEDSVPLWEPCPLASLGIEGEAASLHVSFSVQCAEGPGV